MPPALNFTNTGHLLIRDVERECAGFTQKGFAEHCGVTPSTVCRWGKPCSESDSLPMPGWAVEALADYTGRPDVIYRRLLARHGWRPVRDAEPAERTGDRPRASAELGQRVAALTVAVLQAEADGNIDTREAARLAADLDDIAQRVANLKAGIGPRAVG